VAVHSGQGIGKIRLIPKPVASVFRLTVYDIPRNAEALRFLCNKRHVISPCPIPGGHGRRHRMRTGIAGINAMVFIQHRLVVAAHPGGRRDGRTDPHANLRAALLGCHNQRLMPMFLRPERSGHIL